MVPLRRLVGNLSGRKGTSSAGLRPANAGIVVHEPQIGLGFATAVVMHAECSTNLKGQCATRDTSSETRRRLLKAVQRKLSTYPRNVPILAPKLFVNNDSSFPDPIYMCAQLFQILLLSRQVHL